MVVIILMEAKAVKELIFIILEYDLELYFKNIGELIDVAVMRDKNSGRSRGFAFVTFIVYPTVSEVETALKSLDRPLESADFLSCAACVKLNKAML